MLSSVHSFVCLRNSIISRIVKMRVNRVDKAVLLGKSTGIQSIKPYGLLIAIAVILTASLSRPAVAVSPDIRTAKDPVIVSVELPKVGELFLATPQQWADMVQDLSAALQDAILQEPGRLVILDLGRGKLLFSMLPVQEQEQGIELAGDDASLLYELVMADLLVRIIDETKAQLPNSPISVMGLPIDTRRILIEEVQLSNEHYQIVLDKLAAFVSYRSFILLGSREIEKYTVYRGMPEAFRLREGRPIVFRTNDDWRIFLGDDFDEDFFEFEDTQMAKDDYFPDNDAPSSKDKLALGDLINEKPSIGVNGEAILQHDPFSDPGGGSGGSGGGSSGGGSSGGGGGSDGGGGGGSDGGGDSGGDSGGDTGSGGDSGGAAGGGGAGGGGGNGGGGGAGGGGGGDPWNPDGEVDGDADEPDDGGFEDPNDDQDNNDPPPSGDVPVIPAGGGFSSPTNEPAAIGSPSDDGFDAKVIAHFDVVPYQTFTGDFNFGVVAFHKNGIDRVEFSANGGSWTPVTEMTLNTRTNVWEYWAILSAEDFDDGPVEVRAIAYPKDAGEPRLLSYQYVFNGGPQVFGCQLYANAGGTLPSEVRYVNPGESVAAAVSSIQTAQGGDGGGGIVYLNAGSHDVGNINSFVAANRWLTIAGAPGTTRDQVIVTAGRTGKNGGLLKIQGMTLTTFFGDTNVKAIWGQDLFMQGTGADDASLPWHRTSHEGYNFGIYFTASEIRDMHSPGIKYVIQRNLVLHNIGRDLLRSPRLVVNIQATNHGYCTTDCHPDFVQWHVPALDSAENFIIYNVVSYNASQAIQGIYNGGTIDTFNNVAIVNVHIDKTDSSTSNGQWRQLATNHFLLWHITHDNVGFRIDDTANVTNLSVRGSCWDSFGMSPATAAIHEDDFFNNHFIQTAGGQQFGGGVDPTIGDPGWLNPDANDYRPGPNSSLKNRLNSMLTSGDAIAIQRSTIISPTSDVGAMEHE